MHFHGTYRERHTFRKFQDRNFKKIDIFNLEAIYEMTETDTRVRVRSKWQQFFELWLKRWAIIMKMSQLQVTNWTTDDPKNQASYQLDYALACS